MNFKLIRVNDLVSYQDGLDLQMKWFDKVENREIDGAVIVLEHKPVLTMGIRTDKANLLVTEEYLNHHGVELFQVDRGGDITFHGPGQIVVYPILRFRDFDLRLAEYMHQLESVIMDTLAKHGIVSTRRDAFPGVWVNNTKICAIGVRARKFITYHGLAFNVHTDKNYFRLINPCGITDYEVSTMSDFKNNLDIETIKDDVISSFEKVFNVTLEKTKE